MLEKTLQICQQDILLSVDFQITEILTQINEPD